MISERVRRVVELAVLRLPGAVLEKAGAEVLEVGLPIPGVTVKVGRNSGKRGPLLAVRLVVRGRHVAMRWFPEGASDSSLARRFAFLVRGMLGEAFDRAPRVRAPHPSTKVETWLSKKESNRVDAAAGARGMTAAELIRRGIVLALRETDALDDLELAEERELRGVLRFLAGTEVVTPGPAIVAYEVGAAEELIRAIRSTCRTFEREGATKLLDEVRTQEARTRGAEPATPSEAQAS